MKLPRGYSHPVRIGKGSFSTVFRAYQKRLERPVALKMLPLRRAANASKVEREARQEARILSTANLPCVPHIFDIHRIGTTVVIVMEWIYGVPLSRLIERGLSEGAICAIASELIHALTLLHGGNIAHRDLKPENVIVTPDRGVFLVDFGFSSLDRADRPTDITSLQGTPAFMAPELWVHQETIDFKKADLYALGVMLQHLLETKFPESAAALLQSDPALRPADSASFEKKWLECCPHHDAASVRPEIAGAAAEYTAKLLFEGARDLYGNGRKEEAYALLIESLDAWPDNPEALDFLQNRFSLPLRTGWRQKLLFRSAAVLVAAVALTAAYVLGVRSTAPRVVADNGLVEDTEERRLTLPTEAAAHNRQQLPALPAVLRGITATGELTGKVSVIPPAVSGTLLIDGQPLRQSPGKGHVTLALPAGTHRVEWSDPTTGGRYGETIDVVPFALQTISLRRFMYDK